MERQHENHMARPLNLGASEKDRKRAEGGGDYEELRRNPSQGNDCPQVGGLGAMLETLLPPAPSTGPRALEVWVASGAKRWKNRAESNTPQLIFEALGPSSS